MSRCARSRAEIFESIPSTWFMRAIVPSAAVTLL